MLVKWIRPAVGNGFGNLLKKNGDEETYRVIQDVYQLASQVLKEAKAAGLDFEYTEGSKDWPEPNPFYYQTRQGFELYIGAAPSHIATPFGKIKIFGGGSSRGYSPQSVSEVFIKRLNGIFKGVTSSRSFLGDERGVLRKVDFSPGNTIRELSKSDFQGITEEEMEREQGSQKLILNSLCGNESIYEIGQVGGRALLPVQHYSQRSQQRSYELINKIWSMLEQKRSGQDPIADRKKPISAVFQPAKEEISSLKNLNQIAELGILHVRRLSEQPIFRGRTSLSFPQKVLVLPDYQEALGLEVLNNGAKKFLDKSNHWHIHTFGSGNNRLVLDGKDLGDGLTLWIPQNNHPCSLEVLEGAYKSALKDIGLGWKPAALKDYPDILHTESEEEYALFVKENGNDLLMRVVASQVGLSKFLSCHNDWKGFERRNTIYLWVKKDKMPQVFESLQI